MSRPVVSMAALHSEDRGIKSSLGVTREGFRDVQVLEPYAPFGGSRETSAKEVKSEVI